MKKLPVILTLTILGLTLCISYSSDQRKMESVADESIEETAASYESDDESNDTNAGLSTYLKQCTPYTDIFTHPFTGEELNREVVGLNADGLCEYNEEMPNDGLMECKFSEQTRKVMAQYYDDVVISGPGSMNFNTGTYTLDGKTVTNPLDEVMNNGTCTISGY
jgi:hypothetical protein